jgi:hypothetical protein
MFFLDLFLVLVIAFVLTVIFAAGIMRLRGLGALLFFFVFLFLATWAAGIWVSPFGPVVRDAPLFAFLVVGVLFALLLAAIIPPAGKPETRREALEQREMQKEAQLVFNVFAWVLIAGLIVVIALHYSY